MVRSSCTGLAKTIFSQKQHESTHVLRAALHAVKGAMAVLLGCFACGFAANTMAAEAPPVLLLANAGEPQTLDPHRYNLRLEETLLNDLFMGLTTFNAQGEIVPGAATGWRTSTDGLTWTFTLRPNQTWSDGHPLTAHDFVFAFRRLQNPQTAASLAYFMDMLENATAINAGQRPPEDLGVHAADDLTLVLRLAKPYPFLLERLLYPTAFPVPAHQIEKHGDDWVKAQNWVSNGAYTLKEWVPQSHIELEVNRSFAGEQPEISRARYIPVVNEQSAYNRYRNQELHAIPSFPAGELAKLRGSPDLRQSDLLSMFYLVFNTRSAPFNDPRVREALSLAIDQGVLTDKVLRNGSAAQYTFTPSLLTGYDGVPVPHAGQPVSERVRRAAALLADAGYDRSNPLDITLRHVAVLETKKVNLAIAAMWKRLGVKVQLRQADIRSHFGDLRQADFQVAWAGWVGENNAEHYLGLLKSDIGDVNYGGFADQEYDALMQKASLQADADLRNALLLQAEAVAARRYPVVPLYSGAVRRLVRPELSGWHENPRDMHPLRYLSWQD